MFPDTPFDPNAANILRDPATTERAAEAEMKANRLEMEVNHLALICESLWNLLKEKHGYSDQELIDQASLIVLKDGRPDARKKPPAPRQCPKCKRMLMRYQSACPYCGNFLQPTLFE